MRATANGTLFSPQAMPRCLRTLQNYGHHVSQIITCGYKTIKMHLMALRIEFRHHSGRASGQLFKMHLMALRIGLNGIAWTEKWILPASHSMIAVPNAAE
jgi:hypothetical protein